MLTSERGPSVGQAPSLFQPRRDSTPARGSRWLRWAAALLGWLGTVLAVVFPLLPVQQDTVELRWPSAAGGTASVTAPLVSYRPESLQATLGCQAIRDLDARTTGRAMVVSTSPQGSPSGLQLGMTLWVAEGILTLTNRGQQVTSGQLPGDCTVTISSDAHRTTVDVGRSHLVAQDGDRRPQVVGIYSDLDGRRDHVAGTSVRIIADTRFVTTASTWKIAVGIGAVLAFLASLAALHAMDVREGRRAPRVTPSGWWKPTPRDVVVVAVLLVWLGIGSLTSDDGYILTMVRAREASGYVGNYYRWFDVPEAPFGWFYELYSVWVRVSASAPWLRLPSALMGLVSWLLISRGMLPRLGRQVRCSTATGWAAAAVFLCFWLPYNNGLRPEPVVVISALVALCAVERAVAIRRLMPVALGLLAAALALAATPTGLIALAPFLAAARPLLRLVRQRAAQFGWSSVLAPIGAAGTVVLVAVFADQTLAAVLEATRVRTLIGPDLGWFEEFFRYQQLFSPTADGSLARRFPVLLLLLFAAVCLVVLLRRNLIPGAALGPSQRLIGSTLVSFALLALTPTKWTHHFGAFAALGAGMAALAALATSASVLRSRRNRLVFLAAVFGVAALSFTGPNAWWYVSNWGVPWFDKPPSIHGLAASTVLLLAAGICLLIATVEHMRGLEAESAASTRPGTVERAGRALRLGTAPVAVICGLLVVFEIASMAKGIQKQAGSYSLGGDILTHAPDTSCGLSDKVLVEPRAADGVLTPLPPPVPVGPGPDEASLAKGFRRDGVPPAGGGSGASGAEYGLHNGLGGDDAPIIGSYDPSGSSTGILRTTWYGLPLAARQGAVPVVISAAGRLRNGNSLTLEFGLRTSNGVQVIDRVPLDDGLVGEPSWRDLRVDLSGRPAALAEQVRVIAEDRSLGPDGWLAVTPPRVPRLTTLTRLVGSQPTFLEFPVGVPNPCLRPFTVHDDIAEMPTYWLSLDNGWSAAQAGGPMGWIKMVSDQELLPTYVAGDPSRDWGLLLRIKPYQPTTAPPDILTGRTQHWGWYTPGRIGEPPPGTQVLQR